MVNPPHLHPPPLTSQPPSSPHLRPDTACSSSCAPPPLLQLFYPVVLVLHRSDMDVSSCEHEEGPAVPLSRPGSEEEPVWENQLLEPVLALTQSGTTEEAVMVRDKQQMSRRATASALIRLKTLPGSVGPQASIQNVLSPTEETTWTAEVSVGPAGHSSFLQTCRFISGQIHIKYRLSLKI